MLALRFFENKLREVQWTMSGDASPPARRN